VVWYGDVMWLLRFRADENDDEGLQVDFARLVGGRGYGYG